MFLCHVRVMWFLSGGHTIGFPPDFQDEGYQLHFPQHSSARMWGMPCLQGNSPVLWNLWAFPPMMWGRTRASRRPRARSGEDQDRMMFKVDLAAKKAGKSMYANPILAIAWHIKYGSLSPKNVMIPTHKNPHLPSAGKFELTRGGWWVVSQDLIHATGLGA